MIAVDDHSGSPQWIIHQIFQTFLVSDFLPLDCCRQLLSRQISATKYLPTFFTQIVTLIAHLAHEFEGSAR